MKYCEANPEGDFTGTIKTIITNKTIKTIPMAPFQIFFIRAIVGAGLAVLFVRMFYGRVQIVYAAGLAIFMVGMAYVLEYFRKKRENKP